jgi:hypothetical protein
MRGYVVQCLFMQLIGIEEGLQAGELLGEGHRGATLRGVNEARF